MNDEMKKKERKKYTRSSQRNKTIVEPMQKLKIVSYREGNNSENTKNNAPIDRHSTNNNSQR